MKTRKLKAALVVAICLLAVAGSAFAHTPPSRKPSERKEIPAVTVAMTMAQPTTNLERS